MVFCGKPSLACYSCRQRRIKCDLRRPGCTQCSNISIACPGYRNKLDLCFRDESATVARKVQCKQKKDVILPERRKPHRKLPNSASPDVFIAVDDAPSFHDDSDLLTLAMAISKTIKQPIEQVAMDHFMLSFAPGSHFDYLPNLYNFTMLDGPFTSALYASALANLSRESRAPELLKSAQFHYSCALTKVNSAIRCPQEALLDTTLVSVLLLGLYDTLTQESRELPDSWTAHTDGAAALLQARGMGQLQSELGFQLFLQVSSNVRVSSAQRQVGVSPEFLALNEQALPYLDHSNPNLRFSLIVNAFAKLRAVTAIGNLYDSSFVIDSALQLDQRLLLVMATMPDNWQYEISSTDDIKTKAYKDIVHRYPNHRIAQLWNSLRMMRIFLNELINKEILVMIEAGLIGSCGEIPTEWTCLQDLTARNVVQMATDICGSVPQFAKTCPNRPLAVAPAAFLLWPLAAAGESDLSPQSIREYVINRLKFFGQEARLPQAAWAAQMIEEGKKLEDWLHMYHLV